MKKHVLFVMMTLTFVCVVFGQTGNPPRNATANEIMQGFRMSDNCQDAIKRFPTNLQGGFEGVYITFTSFMGQTDEEVLELMNMFLMVNYLKTNVILVGKGNEKVGETDTTFSQNYSQMRSAGVQAAAMFPIAMGLSGNPGGTNWDVWGQYFLQFL
jgi:hypothetical protein